MRVQSVAIAFLAGCNGVFGLDPVGTEPADVDGDGLAYDNCRDIANPDQADADDDGLGDACDPCVASPDQLFVDADRDKLDDGCDPCPLGKQHDEDGDGIFDACDNCPGTANADQGNADGDGVGDVCEVGGATSPNVRTFFDAFAPGDPRWVSVGMDWQNTGDAIESPMLPPLAASFSARRSPSFPMAGDSWLLELRVEPLFTEYRLIVRLDESASGTIATCQVSCSSGCYVILDDGTGPKLNTNTFKGLEPYRLQVTHVRNGKLTCGVVGEPTTFTSSSAAFDTHAGFSISTNNALRFTYVYAQN